MAHIHDKTKNPTDHTLLHTTSKTHAHTADCSNEQKIMVQIWVDEVAQLHWYDVYMKQQQWVPIGFSKPPDPTCCAAMSEQSWRDKSDWPIIKSPQHGLPKSMKWTNKMMNRQESTIDITTTGYESDATAQKVTRQRNDDATSTGDKIEKKSKATSNEHPWATNWQYNRQGWNGQRQKPSHQNWSSSTEKVKDDHKWQRPTERTA